MPATLLVLDIDGTLRPHGEPRVPKENVDALRTVQKAGVKLVIATGRCRAENPAKMLRGLLPELRPALLLAACYLTFSLILIIQPHSLRSSVSFSGFAVAAQISRFLPSVRLGSLLVSLVVCYRHLFSLRAHAAEKASLTIQSLSAKIRKKQKKE